MSHLIDLQRRMTCTRKKCRETLKYISTYIKKINNKVYIKGNNVVKGGKEEKGMHQGRGRTKDHMKDE